MSGRSKIKSARRAVEEAQTKLERLVSEASPAPRAHKVTVSEIVRSAFEELSAARASLKELESPRLRENLDSAREAVAKAEAELERVLKELDVADTEDTTWVTAKVEAAFEVVRAASLRLGRLERRFDEGEG